MTNELQTAPAKGVKFYLYGPTEANIDGVRVSVGTERERCMVARLLLAKGQAVTRTELVEHMWDHPPNSAPDILNRCMMNFRSRLTELGLKHTLINRDGLCRFTIDPDRVDAHQLTALVADVENLEPETAVERLREQLAVCVGEPLAGLSNHRLDGYRQTLLEHRRNAEILLFRMDFRLGRVEQHVPTLVGQCQERPVDSDITGLTMYALHATGRQAEALTTYQRHSQHLIELGMELPDRMRDLHTRILNNDSALEPEPTAFPFGDTGPAVEPTPEKEHRTGKQAPQVVNKINGKVRGKYIVFGVDNRSTR